MRVFVAGATGAIGLRLVAALVRAGHSVTGMTRTQSKAGSLRVGASPAVADALDSAATLAAVRNAAPEVLIHELTAIPARLNFRKIDREFELTNLLRTKGTANLLAGAQAVGVRRFIAQSYAAWPYAREGGAVKTEQDPLDPKPPVALREMLRAIRYLESAVLGASSLEGIVLRYGAFYGPGTSISDSGSAVEDIRRRRFPVVGSGNGVWSLIHIDDAAQATVAAAERGSPGIYNIVDDVWSRNDDRNSRRLERQGEE